MVIKKDKKYKLKQKSETKKDKVEKSQEGESEDMKKISTLLEDLYLLESYSADLFSFSPLPICYLNPIGVVLEVNPAFEKISGYNDYEIIGEPIEKFFEKEKIEEFYKKTLEEGFVKSKEIIFFTKDKKEIFVSAFSQIRKNKEGEAIGYFISFFDLTNVKETESVLKDSQKALLNILEDTEKTRKEAEEEKDKTVAIITNFADGVLVFDQNQKLSLINPNAESYFNISSKDITGKLFSEIAEISNFKLLIDILGKEMKEIFRKEIQLNENLVLEVSTISVIKEKIKLGTLIILHNITREKIVERMKTEFVSIAAHQLRTPLSAIKWTLQMLLDGDLGEITEEQKDFIKKTYISNERMISLINDLLSATRIEEGRYIYKPTLAKIENMVENVINSYKEAARRRNIKLEFNKPKIKLPQVMIDVEEVNLAISNLIDNAIKYTLPNGTVKIFLKNNKTEIEFSVQDSGMGISQDQQTRLFSKFFRGANAIKAETEGSGLGLFIVKNIIEAHGGKIWFKSEENKGSTFYFTIPVKKEFEEFIKEL